MAACAPTRSAASHPSCEDVLVPPATLSSNMKVTICYVESPSLFFVYANEKRYENLDLMLNVFMGEYGALMRLAEPPAPGSHVVCKFTADDRYYRAAVLAWPDAEHATPGRRVAVHYLDYGNSEVVRWEEGRLFRLWPHFAKMAPVQAIPCAHFGVQPIAFGGWTEKETRTFRQRIDDFSNELSAKLICKFRRPPAQTRRGLESVLAYVELFRLGPELEAGESSFDFVKDIGKPWIQGPECSYPLEISIKNALPTGFADLEWVCEEGASLVTSPVDEGSKGEAESSSGSCLEEEDRNRTATREAKQKEESKKSGSGRKKEEDKKAEEEKMMAEERWKMEEKRKIEEKRKEEERRKEEKEKERKRREWEVMQREMRRQELENKKREEEERRREERRKHEEERKRKEEREDEERKREERRKQEEEWKRIEEKENEERRRKEERLKEERKREERRKQEEERRRKEEKEKEERKREERRKQEEERRRKEEKEKEERKREEKRKQEEERRKEEKEKEERKREERRMQEEERKRREQKEEEERVRKAKEEEEQRQKAAADFAAPQRAKVSFTWKKVQKKPSWKGENVTKIETEEMNAPPRRKEEKEEVEEEEDSRSPSPITTFACTPPTLPSKFPNGSVRITTRFEGLPDLVLALQSDGGLPVMPFHVESPASFELCFVTEETTAMMQWVEKAMTDHYCWALSGQLLRMFEGFEPEVGTLVCAADDDLFLRASVMKTNYGAEVPSQRTALLRFIDYGGEKWLSLKLIYPLSPSMLAVPPLSLACCLFGVEPLGLEWSEEGMALFKKSLEESTPEEQTGGRGLIAHLIDAMPDGVLSSRFRLRVMLRNEANSLVNVTLVEMREPRVARVSAEFHAVLENMVSSGAKAKRQMESEELEEEWRITHDIHRQSLAQKNDASSRYSHSHRVCEYFRVQGRCVWGQNCRFLHVRDTDAKNVNLNFERNVADVSEVAFLDSGDHMDYPAVGALIGLKVTAVYAPNRFYAQLLHGPEDYLERSELEPELCDTSKRSFQSLETMTEAMGLHYNELTPRQLKDELYAPGEVVAVRSRSDKQWYRARVLDHDSSCVQVSVFLLDTGDVELLHQMWVHPLLWTFLEGLPIQAFECALKGIARPDGGWTETALTFIRDHMDGKPLHARVEDVNPSGTLLVTVWDNFDCRGTSGEISLNDLLISKNFAVPHSSRPAASSGWTCSDDPNFVIYPA